MSKASMVIRGVLKQAAQRLSERYDNGEVVRGSIRNITGELGVAVEFDVSHQRVRVQLIPNVRTVAEWSVDIYASVLGQEMTVTESMLRTGMHSTGRVDSVSFQYSPDSPEFDLGLLTLGVLGGAVDAVKNVLP